MLKKCKNKFDCLVNEMLYIKQLRPPLNVQTDSICAKVFVLAFFIHQILFVFLDNCVMMSPKRRNIVSLLSKCLCNENFMLLSFL